MKPTAVNELGRIVQVIELNDVAAVNAMLANGWYLLNVCNSRKYGHSKPVYSVGRVETDEETAWQHKM